MTRILSIALVCSLAACQPTAVDTVARDAAVCNLPPISPTLWDGKTFPTVVSDAVSIYLSQKCLDAKYALGMVVDGTKVVSTVRLLPDQVGSYVSQALSPCPQGLAATGALDGNAIDLRCIPLLSVVKIPCGPRPPGLTNQNGVLPVNLNAAFHDAYDLLSAEIDAGQLCPGKQ